MDKFEQAESDYNKKYDPYDTVCSECNAPTDECICGEIEDVGDGEL